MIECAKSEIDGTFPAHRRFDSDRLRHDFWRGEAQRLGSLLAAIILLAGCGGAGTTIRPFTTDGCSAFPDGTVQQRQLWRDCCVAHDRAYWRGGTYNERRAADRALETCVASAGEPAIAKIMLAGVRVGGSPWWPTQFRWGYGWPWPRGYQALTAEEIKQVEFALTATPRSSP